MEDSYKLHKHSVEFDDWQGGYQKLNIPNKEFMRKREKLEEEN